MRKKAFTLVEILVAISIIGALASISIFYLRSVKEKQRKAEVRSNISLISLAAQSMKADIGVFPGGEKYLQVKNKQLSIASAGMTQYYSGPTVDVWGGSYMFNYQYKSMHVCKGSGSPTACTNIYFDQIAAYSMGPNKTSTANNANTCDDIYKSLYKEPISAGVTEVEGCAGGFKGTVVE